MRRVLAALAAAALLTSLAAPSASAAGPHASLTIAPRTSAIYLYDGSAAGTGPGIPAVGVGATFRGCTPPELEPVLFATLQQDGVSFAWATSALGAGYYECRYETGKRMQIGMGFFGPTLHSGTATAHFAMMRSTPTGWVVIAEDTRTVRIP